MKFKKIIVVGALVTIVAVNSVVSFATEQTSSVNKSEGTNTETTSQKKEALKLTLKNAIEYALEHNQDIIIQETKIEKTNIEYDQNMRAIRAYDKTEKSSADIPPMIYPAITTEMSINRELYDLRAVQRYVDFTLQQSKWDKEILINDIKNKVSKAYYDLLLKQEEKKIAEENLKLAQKQYSNSELLLANGLISEHQHLMTKMAVSQAKAASEGANTMYQVQLLSFNNVIGANLDTEIVLLDSITKPDTKLVSIEDAIKQAFENNVSLKSVHENYEIQKLTLDAVKIKFPEITYKYKEQQVAVEEAAKNVQLVKNGIEMGLRASYLNIASIKDNIGIYEDSVRLAERSLEIAELNNKLGMNTTQDVTQARISLMEAKKGYLNYLYQYHTALIDYQDSMGFGRKMN